MFPPAAALLTLTLRLALDEAFRQNCGGADATVRGCGYGSL